MSEHTCDPDNIVPYCYNCAKYNPECKGAHEWHDITYVRNGYFECEEC